MSSLHLLGVCSTLLTALTTVLVIQRRKQHAYLRQLIEREREFHTLAECSPDFVMRNDREGRVVYMNARLQALVGQSLDQVIGKTFLDRWPDGRYADLEAAGVRAMALGEEVVIQVGVPSGGTHQIHVVPERDAGGAIVGTVAFGRDITALMQSWRDTREARDFLSLAIDAISDPIFLKDREHRWVLMNQACCALVGQPRENLIGKSDFDFFPENQARVFWDKDELVFTAGIVNVNEEKITDGKGVTRIIVTKKSPISTAEGKQFLVGVISDISARKQTERLLRAREREFRTLAQNLPDLMARYDRQGRFVYVNPKFEMQIGVRLDELRDKTPTQVPGLPEAEFFEQQVRTAVATGMADEFEHHVQTAGGHAIWGLIHIVPEFDEAGQVTFVQVVIRDITAIREAQAHMSRFVANAPGFIYTMRRDAAGRTSLPFVSPGIEDIYGVRPEDVIDDAASIFQIFHPDDLDRGRVELRASARELTPFQFEFRVRRPDMPERWIEARALPEREADGGTLWHGIQIDITQRKRAEQALHESRKLLGEAQRLAHVGSWELDLVDNVLTWSDEIFRIFEIDPRQFGASYDAFLDAIHPADREAVNRAYTESLENRTPYEIEHRLCMADGRIKYVHERGETEYAEDGKPLRSVGTVQDITEPRLAEVTLRESEEKLRGLYELSPLGIALTDMSGRYLEFNEAFRAVCGHPADELKILDYWTLTPREYESQEVEQLEALSRTGRYGPYEKEYVQKDGRRIPIRLNGMMLTGRDGQRYIWSIVEDITERKRLEVELMESRNFLSRVANSISDPVFVKDRQHRWILMNDAFGTLLGQPREVLLGKSDYDFLPKEQADVFWDKDELVFESGKTNVNEEAITGGDGVLRHIQTKRTPFLSGDGRVLLVGVIRDITDRRRAELALHENLDRITELNIHLKRHAVELNASQEQLKLTKTWYRSILQSAPDGMLVIDRQGVIVQANAQIEIMFGYEEKELIGNRVEMLLPAAIREIHVGKRIDFVAGGRTDRPMAAIRNLRGCRKDGSEFPVDISLSQLPDIAGRAGAICAAIRDTTERKRLEDELVRRENEFRTLVENSPDTVIRYDRGCRRIYCNPAILEFMGVSLADILGKTTAEYSPYPPDVAAAVTALVQQVIDTGQAGEMELRWEKNGAPAWLLFRVNPEFDHAGRVVGALSVGRDVTLLKETELELQQSRDLLRTLMAHQTKDLEEERKRIAWEVHEELGQNLMALRMNLSMLYAQMDRDGTPMQAQFQSTRDIVDRSIQVARTVTATLHPKVLDLGIVPALEWLSDEFIKHTAVACELHLDMADISMSEEYVIAFFRIAEEALDNVTQHAEASRVEITLGCRERDYFLRVFDDGRGFDTNTLKKKSVGLLKVQELTRALSGVTSILSTPGSGTVIEVRIPHAA